MSTLNDRNRLQRQQRGVIVGRLERLGLEVKVYPGRLYAWREKDFVAAFYWIANVGWRADVRSPPIFAIGDLDPAIHEIQRAMAAHDSIRSAWATWAKTRSEKAWMDYQGKLAAYWLRIEHKEEPDGPPLGT